MNEVVSIPMTDNTIFLPMKCFDVIDCRVIMITCSIMVEQNDLEYDWIYKDYFDVEIYEQNELMLWQGEWNKINDENLERCIRERVKNGYYDYDLAYKKLKLLG